MCGAKEVVRGAGSMAQQGKSSPSEPGVLTPIPGTNGNVEGKNQLHKAGLCRPHVNHCNVPLDTHMHAHAHAQECTRARMHTHTHPHEPIQQ